MEDSALTIGRTDPDPIIGGSWMQQKNQMA